MRFSIFTPTHNPQYLPELFLTLLAQSNRDWEWVIVPNNGALIPPDIVAHPQVRVCHAPDSMSGIGALKRYACEQCWGDWLIEVDHDDLLSWRALERISAAIEAHPRAGFIYSDCANFYPDGTYQLYGQEYGWEHRFEGFVNGRQVLANISREPSAESMSSIHTAPDHVRCFRVVDYWREGGHTALLHVCDDYELLCRLYAAGVEFHHIPETLYLYRLLPESGNSFLQYNADIQQLQAIISQQYQSAMQSRDSS